MTLLPGQNRRLALYDSPIPFGTQVVLVAPMALLQANETETVHYDNLRVEYDPPNDFMQNALHGDDFSGHGNSPYGLAQPTGWVEYGTDYFVEAGFDFITATNPTWVGEVIDPPGRDTGIFKHFTIQADHLKGDLLTTRVFASATFTDPESFVMLRVQIDPFETGAIWHDSQRLRLNGYDTLSIRRLAIPEGASSVHAMVVGYFGPNETASFYADDIELEVQRHSAQLRATDIGGLALDGLRRFERVVSVIVPDVVPIDPETFSDDPFPWNQNPGSSPAGSVVLTLAGGSEGTINCSYQPTFVGYAFSSCSNGTIAGSFVEADTASLQMVAGGTRVELLLQYVDQCSGSSCSCPSGYSLQNGLCVANDACDALSSCPAPAQCTFYGNHDGSRGDAQIVTVDFVSEIVTPVGSVHSRADIEGLAIHPTTSLIYAAVGRARIGRTTYNGWIHVIDGLTADLVPMPQYSGYRNIEAMAFHPVDRTLWAWSQDQGLLQIDPVTGVGTLTVSSSLGVEGMSWGLDGQLLYLAVNRDIWVFDPDDGSFTEQNNAMPTETEALDMGPDGFLTGMTGTNGTGTAYGYDPHAQQVVWQKNLSTTYHDLEGLAFPAACR